MRLLAAIHPPDVTQAILDCLDLPSGAPPPAAARPDPNAVKELAGGLRSDPLSPSAGLGGSTIAAHARAPEVTLAAL
jgi:hypothetical protein